MHNLNSKWAPTDHLRIKMNIIGRGNGVRIVYEEDEMQSKHRNQIHTKLRQAAWINCKTFNF